MAVVRVLCCDVSAVTQEQYKALYAQATPSRQRRADGYRFREDSLRCLAAEALLRYALPQADLSQLSREPGGKPTLPGFHFNLSHSGPWVAVAVGDAPLGVDVECLREGRDTEAIARRWFTPREQAYVGQDPERFARIWTAKESRLKRAGTGLRKALNSFCVLEDSECKTWLLPGAALTLCAGEHPEAWEPVAVTALIHEYTGR